MPFPSVLCYPFPLKPKHLLSTLLSDTLSTTSSLHLTDQVSHPYTVTEKIAVLYILMFIFLDSKLEDKRFWVAQ
jgi:hypothetical protein